jgi:FkbM family methyltransferase
MQSIDFMCFDNGLSKFVSEAILNGEVYCAFPDLAPVDVIVDIGANVGAATVFFKKTYPNAAIYSFEPGPEPFDLLQSNTSYYRDIHCINYGLFDIDATVKLYIGKNDHVTTSIYQNNLVTSEFNEKKLRKASLLFETLGIKSIDILKIDTEGCEVNILRNMVSYLTAVKVMYVEYHSELDRILIDVILRKTHTLYNSKAESPHRGDLTYINNSMESEYRYKLIE